MITLEEVGLSTRTIEALRRHFGENVTVTEITAMTDKLLMRNADIGRKTIKEIRELIPNKVRLNTISHTRRP